MNEQSPNQSPNQSQTQPQNPISTKAILVRGASTALITQTLSAGVIYAVQVMLARWMGVAEYGIYEYVSTVAIVLGFLAGFGLSNAALRHIPEYLVQQDWAHLRGMIWGAWGQTLVASLATAGCAVLIILGLRPEHTNALVLGMGTVPLLAMIRLQLEMARGTQKIALAYIPFMLLYPLAMMGITFVWFQTHGSLDSVHALVLSLICLFVILIVQWIAFHWGLPSEIRQVPAAFKFRQWLMESMPLLLIDGSFLILNHTDTLMINAFLGAKEVGIYSAAMKTSAWVHFILAAVNAIAAPLFSTLYTQGDRQELQRLVSTIARWMFYPAFLIALGLMLFADPVLNLFGAEFAAAKWTMIVLMLGQLVNVGAGSVGYLLMMTGHHNQCASVVACSALFNILLNWVGIPWLGILGAAIATAIAMSLWNIWLNRLVVRHLGVNPSIIAALFSRYDQHFSN